MTPGKCPHCGEMLNLKGDSCPKCGDNPYRSPSPVDARPGASFGLATLLGVITIIAVCLGMGMLYPPLGIGLAVLCTPALIRTGIAMQRRQRRGDSPAWEARVVFFLGSVGIMLGLAVATGVTFYATCWAGFAAGTGISSMAGAKEYDPLGYGLVTGLVLGVAVGLIVLVWLGFKFLPIERKPRKLPAD